MRMKLSGGKENMGRDTFDTKGSKIKRKGTTYERKERENDEHVCKCEA